MTSRDPEQTLRNRVINGLTERLNDLLPRVLEITGYSSELSLKAKIGGKHATFMDIRSEVIVSPEQFVLLWMKGLIRHLDSYGESRRYKADYELFQFIKNYLPVREYTELFLQRTYLRNFHALSRVRPNDEDAVIWIGQENASYGLLVTPRFRDGMWENDGSEIRHFKQNYWTIGHILETGLVVPNENEKIAFSDSEQYLTFFKNVLVRASGSRYEKEIAQLYCNYVRGSSDPLNIPLLIPEFRYGGLDRNHRYRLDFTIIDPYSMSKFGFELSPWSSHGQLTGIRGMTQKQINEIAKANFEREMKKHKEYFRTFGIYILIYTDSDLENIESVFGDMENYLNPKKVPVQLRIHVWDEFMNYE